MKTCGKCLEEMPTEKFSKKARSKDGYSSNCKDCHNTYSREVWYPKNKDKQVQSSSDWKEKNKSKVIASRHSVPLEQVEAILDSSDGCCEICGEEVKLFVDHCHDSSVVRGLLCRTCNSALGFLGDTPEKVLRLLPKIEQYFNK